MPEGVHKGLDAAAALNAHHIAAVVLCQCSQEVDCCVCGDWAWVCQQQIHSRLYAMHPPDLVLPGQREPSDTYSLIVNLHGPQLQGQTRGLQQREGPNLCQKCFD